MVLVEAAFISVRIVNLDSLIFKRIQMNLNVPVYFLKNKIKELENKKKNLELKEKERYEENGLRKLERNELNERKWGLELIVVLNKKKRNFK